MCGFIKEWIENWKEDKKRNSEIENPGNMSDLLKIVAMKDPKYVKEFIEYNEEILKECHINGDRAVDLIKTVGDPEYIKECLGNVEKMKALDINGDRAVDLIKTVGDPEYIKEYLENVEKMQALDIYGGKVTELLTVEELEPKYIEEWLENIERMRALKIQDFIAADLIKKVEQKIPGYIKKCLENVEKMQALNIQDFIAVDLIKKVEQKVPGYIKKCLENVEKMQALNIQKSNTIDLIRMVEKKEPGYIKKYIKKHIKNGKVNELESDFLIQVIIMTADAKFIDYCKDSGVLNHKTIERLDRFTKISPITLPGQMTIGVEIESEGLASREEIEKIIGNLLKERTWELSSDITLINGTEAISPILRKDTASHEIYTVCNALYSLGQETSERCGGHIHIGADYLTDLQDWKNLRNIWNNTEKILYIISNRKGEIPREEVLKYAKPISGKDESKQKTINLESESDLENFIAGIKKYKETDFRQLIMLMLEKKKKTQ